MDISHAATEDMDECQAQEQDPIMCESQDLTDGEVPLLESFECHFLTSENGLEIHPNMKKRLIRKEFKCKLCSYQTKRSDYLEQHMHQHSFTGDSSTSICATIEPGVKCQINQGDPEVKCAECGFIAKKKSHLKIHLAKHVRARKVGKKESLKCAICSYECAKEDTMERHYTKHKERQEVVEVFSCDMCEYRTKWKCAMKRHIIGHVSEYLYKCTMCSYESKHKDSLKGHMLVHKDKSEVRMFYCDQCDFQTKRKKTLKVHVENHFSDKLFSCTICSYKTKYKYIFNKHMLIHSDKTGEEVFNCNKCKFKTKRKGNLENHLLKHKIQEQDNCYDVLIE